MKIGFVWTLSKKTKSETDLRLFPGPVYAKDVSREIDHHSIDELVKGWEKLLTNLKRQTIHPILLVYCPTVPFIQSGAVHFWDENENLVSEFNKVCKDQKIRFINMGEEFNRFYTNTGRFPRGFRNSRPSFGHLNQDGHRLVAEAIHNAITPF